MQHRADLDKWTQARRWVCIRLQTTAYTWLHWNSLQRSQFVLNILQMQGKVLTLGWTLAPLHPRSQRCHGRASLGRSPRCAHPACAFGASRCSISASWRHRSHDHPLILTFMNCCIKVFSFDRYCKFLNIDFVMIYMTLRSDMISCRQMFDQPCMNRIDTFIAHRSMTGTALTKRQQHHQALEGRRKAHRVWLANKCLSCCYCVAKGQISQRSSLTWCKWENLHAAKNTY